MSDYVIKTNSGKVQGYERNGMVEYLGIPYARPPVGALRLKRAKPVKPWLRNFGCQGLRACVCSVFYGSKHGGRGLPSVKHSNPSGRGEASGAGLYSWGRL